MLWDTLLQTCNFSLLLFSDCLHFQLGELQPKKTCSLKQTTKLQNPNTNSKWNHKKQSTTYCSENMHLNSRTCGLVSLWLKIVNMTTSKNMMYNWGDLFYTFYSLIGTSSSSRLCSYKIRCNCSFPNHFNNKKQRWETRLEEKTINDTNDTNLPIIVIKLNKGETIYIINKRMILSLDNLRLHTPVH